MLAGALLAALYGRARLNRLLTITQLSWIVALAPLAAFVLLALRVPAANAGTVYTWEWQWLPSLGLSLGFYVDDLSLLLRPAGHLHRRAGHRLHRLLFQGDQTAWRFLTYLMLFMVSMLGLVLAGDVLTLFIFWEGTSILSYLLVAYKTKSEAARYGAFRALVITGGGGIALLGGLLFVGRWPAAPTSPPC